MYIEWTNITRCWLEWIYMYIKYIKASSSALRSKSYSIYRLPWHRHIEQHSTDTGSDIMSINRQFFCQIQWIHNRCLLFINNNSCINSKLHCTLLKITHKIPLTLLITLTLDLKETGKVLGLHSVCQRFLQLYLIQVCV